MTFEAPTSDMTIVDSPDAKNDLSDSTTTRIAVTLMIARSALSPSSPRLRRAAMRHWA
jgi:hypothetical protein